MLLKFGSKKKEKAPLLNLPNKVEIQQDFEQPVVTTGVAATPSTATINAILQQGIKAAQKGDFQAAKAHFHTIYNLQRSNETALLWLGYLSENPAEAVGYYQILLRYHPGHRQAGQLLDEALAEAYVAKFYSKQKSSSNMNKKNATPTTCLPWLGELFVKEGIITASQLNIALDCQFSLGYNNKWQPLGEMLLQLGFIKRQQLEATLQLQRQQRAKYPQAEATM